MQRRHTIIGLIAFICAIVLPLGCFYWFINVEMPRQFSDFAAIWNSTDALTHYVQTKNEWPRNLNDLAPSLKFVGGTPDDLAFYDEQVSINFEFDLESPPRDGVWFVRLKSGRMAPEETNANLRIRRFIEAYQAKGVEKPVDSSVRHP